MRPKAEPFRVPSTPNAYTVGNPNGYEKYLDEDPDAGKGVGGIVFRTREEAQALLDANGGNLPLEWGYGIKPGRVYGLVLPVPFEEATTRDRAKGMAAFHTDDEHEGEPDGCQACKITWRRKPDPLSYDALIVSAPLVRL